jgi:Tfp pilus assembly protein PilF
MNLNIDEEILVFALFNMGSCYFLMGQYDLALETSRKAMAINPQMQENIVTCACSELCAGDVNQAIPALLELLKKSPSYPPALAALAVAYIVSGHKKDGASFIDQLRALRVGVADYLNDFVGYFIKAGRITQAVTLLEASIENNAVHADTHNLLATCRERLMIN